jgi:hypothetical protein
MKPSRKSVVAWLIAAVATAAGVVSNVDNIASTYRKYTGPKPPDLAPYSEGVDNLPIPVRESTTTSPVIVEVLQTPKGSHPYSMYFDVYLFNPTDKDVLFTTIVYESETQIPHGDASDSGPLRVSSQYELIYEFARQGTIPLAPPYRLAKGGRAGIRFHFIPTKPLIEFDGLPHFFTADFLDSEGRKLRFADHVAL